jgi:hypothetical protein
MLQAMDPSRGHPLAVSHLSAGHLEGGCRTRVSTNLVLLPSPGCRYTYI